MIRDTSLKAWDEIKEGLPRRRSQVYWFVKHNPDKTAAELKQIMKAAAHPRWDDAEKRLSELELQGVVNRPGQRACLTTGHTAYVWRAIDGPVKPMPKRQTGITARLQALEEELIDVRQKLDRLTSKEIERQEVEVHQ